MKILLTGSEGFLGSYLLTHLSSQYTITGEDIKIDTLQNIARQGYPAPQYDLIINCAAELFNKDEMIETNVAGVDNLARYCKERKAKLIHFSSVSIYGNSYYGLTKKMGEELINFWNSKGWVILRMTNIYEPQGKGDSPACRFSRGEREIYGDGTHFKDHIHIKDVLRVVEMAIKDDWTGEINLSTGKAMMMYRIFERLGKGQPIFLKDKKPDMEISQLDNTIALKLGWKPTWTIEDEPLTNPLNTML